MFKPEAALESDSMRHVFRVGHDVGDVACALLPDGVIIDGAGGMTAAADATRAALLASERRPLFEATFIHEGVVVRVDLLIPDGDGWHVVEVKSTTRVKPYQRSDLATQLWVMRGCGVPVSKASIRVIDTHFVLLEQGNYHGLFIDEQAGEIVSAIIDSRDGVVTAANMTLDGPEPALTVGAHCSDPFQCSFEAYCYRDLPQAPEWPASLLPGVGGKALARVLMSEGIEDLLLVGKDRISQPLLERVRAATVTGIAYHDAEGVCRDTGDWAFPRTFLDFETIALAIPRWVGTSPYQQVTFQFSAHVDRGDSEVEHREFLSTDGTDPRRACAAALAMLPSTGAVVAWNASFERSCLLNLASLFPAYENALRSLADRLVDLLPVARRHYYHRDMRGSWSIKAVLPTLAPELDYRSLTGAQSGVEAQNAYLEAIEQMTTLERREELRRGLLDYCKRDTTAMVVALDRLQRPSPQAAISQVAPLT
ncbi:DUF2779 domain-containing protein [Sphingomonas endolithica]|uniref:DUF2779 domain-containing protein n=1 Tax=Sphingomonas endolithica TaxID=2972485 RepID=UPI0021AF70E9|nr:DUF2779 domain-containing protein [Sphingomonas sp. ZFBP2030]